MKEFIKYVRLDGHKETIAVGVVEVNGGELRYFGEYQASMLRACVRNEIDAFLQH